MTKEKSDLMYTKHVDIRFFYNVFSHLSVLESLTTVTQRQSKLAKERKIGDILSKHGDMDYIMLWDNFVKRI